MASAPLPALVALRRTWVTLPVEILGSIFARVTARDLLICQRVCRYWYYAASDARLWMRLADEMQAKGIPVPPLDLPTSVVNDELDAQIRADDAPINHEQQQQQRQQQPEGTEPVLPPRSPLQLALMFQVVQAQDLMKRWDTYGCEPLAVQRIRAHIDRITCMKLLRGPQGQLLVLTASVDNWIRVWDLSTLLHPPPPPPPPPPSGTSASSSTTAAAPSTSSTPSSSDPVRTVAVADNLLYTSEAAELRSHSESASSTQPTLPPLRRSMRQSSSNRTASSHERQDPRDDTRPASAAFSSSSESVPTIPQLNRSERASSSSSSTRPSESNGRQRLLAGIDTGVEILCLDAELGTEGSPYENKLVITVGSCVSSSCCMVYVLDLDRASIVLDYQLSSPSSDRFVARAISLRGSRVAVAVYNGDIQVFEWASSRTATISQKRQHAVNALKLLENTIVSVTDSCLIQVFALPDLNVDRPSGSGIAGPGPGTAAHRASNSMFDAAETGMHRTGSIPAGRRRSMHTAESISTSFSRASTPTRSSTPWPPLEDGSDAMRYPSDRLTPEGDIIPPEPGQLLASVPLPFGEAARPLTASFSEELEHRTSYAYRSLRRARSQGHSSDPPHCIVIQVADSRAVSQYALEGLVLPPVERQYDPDWVIDLDLDTPRWSAPQDLPLFPYDWPPTLLARAEVDRVSNTSIGATGQRGVIMSPMIGGIPPVYCVQLLTRRAWSELDDQVDKERDRASWERAALAADTESIAGSISMADDPEPSSTRASTPMSIAGSVAGSVSSYFPDSSATPAPDGIPDPPAFDPSAAADEMSIHTQARAFRAKLAAYLQALRPTPDVGLPSAQTLASSADLRRLERILGPNNLRFNPQMPVSTSAPTPSPSAAPGTAYRRPTPTPGPSHVQHSSISGGSGSGFMPPPRPSSSSSSVMDTTPAFNTRSHTRRQTSAFAVPSTSTATGTLDPSRAPNPVQRRTPAPLRTGPDSSFGPPASSIRPRGTSTGAVGSADTPMSLPLSSPAAPPTPITPANPWPSSSDAPPTSPPPYSRSPGWGSNRASASAPLGSSASSSASLASSPLPPPTAPVTSHTPHAAPPQPLPLEGTTRLGFERMGLPPLGAPRRRSQRQPSISSASSTTSFGQPSRSDIMAEICLDEAAGIICLGTARGNLWIGDYLRPYQTSTATTPNTTAAPQLGRSRPN